MLQSQDELSQLESNLNVNIEADDIELDDLLALLADDTAQDVQDAQDTQLNESSLNKMSCMNKENEYNYKSLTEEVNSTYQLKSHEQLNINEQNIFEITLFQFNNERYYKNMCKIIKLRHESKSCYSSICPFCRVISHKSKQETEISIINEQSEPSINSLINGNLSFIPIESSTISSANTKKRDPISIARSGRAKKMKRNRGMFSKSINDETSN